MEMIVAKGYGATVTFDGEAIAIDRTKLGRALVGVDRTVIPINSVVRVNLSRASFLTNGLFCVSVLLPSGEPSTTYEKPTEASLTPYSAVYTKKQAKGFEKIVKAIESSIPAVPVPIVGVKSSKSLLSYMLREKRRHSNSTNNSPKDDTSRNLGVTMEQLLTCMNIKFGVEKRDVI